MKEDEIERLLGGYATNSLTEEERKALFAAALEDQELFNALEDEEALRDLLADKESRAAIERELLALPHARVREMGRPWFLRGAVLAVASGVAVGIIAFFALFQVNKPDAEIAQLTQEAQSRRVETPQAAKPILDVAPPRPAIKKKVVAPKRELPVPLPVANQKPVPSPVLASNEPAVMARTTSAKSGVVGGFMTAAKLAAPAPLAVTVLLGNAPLGEDHVVKAGDEIRFQLIAPATGMLTLSERTSSGGFQKIGPELSVEAGKEYTVPPDPVVINGAETFRLALVAENAAERSAEFTLTPGQSVQVR